MREGDGEAEEGEGDPQMSQWARSRPEVMAEIAALPAHLQQEALRAAVHVPTVDELEGRDYGPDDEDRGPGR